MYGLKHFSETIKTQLDFYNSEKASKMKKTLRRIDEENSQMINGIDVILKREEVVEMMVMKTANMNANVTNLKI